jgi:hypothetical protein
MDYDFRRIDASQISGLKELVRQIYGNKEPNSISLEEKFNTKSFGAEYVGYAAYDSHQKQIIANNEIPIAYYGVYPTLAKVEKSEILCAQSGDTMTHPNHSGKGLFTTLARMTYDLAKKEGVKFVFGFPNENSLPGFQRKLNWEFPYKMKKFSRFIPTLPVGILKRKMKLHINPLSHICFKLANLFFDVVKPGELFSDQVKRANPYLIRDYRFWNYKSNHTLFVRLDGIGVFLKFDGDLSIGDIIGNPTVNQVKKILRRLYFLAFLLGANRVRSYFSPNSNLSKILSPYGNVSSSLYFGFINFNSEFSPADLDLTFVDYDTF